MPHVKQKSQSLSYLHCTTHSDPSFLHIFFLRFSGHLTSTLIFNRMLSFHILVLLFRSYIMYLPKKLHSCIPTDSVIRPLESPRIWIQKQSSNNDTLTGSSPLGMVAKISMAPSKDQGPPLKPRTYHSYDKNGTKTPTASDI